MPKAAKTGASPKFSPYPAPSTRSSAPRVPALPPPPPPPPPTFSTHLPVLAPAQLQLHSAAPGPAAFLAPLVEYDDEGDQDEEEVNESYRYGAWNGTPSSLHASLSGPSPAGTDATLVQTPSPSAWRVKLPKRDLSLPNAGLNLLADTALLTSSSTTTRQNTAAQIPAAPSTIGLTLDSRIPSPAPTTTSSTTPNSRIGVALAILSRGNPGAVTVSQSIRDLLPVARDALESLRPGGQSFSASLTNSITVRSDAPARATPPPTVDEDISLHDQDSTIQSEYSHYHYDNDVRDHDEEGSLHDGRYDEKMHDEYSPLHDDTVPLHDHDTPLYGESLFYDEDEDIGVPGSEEGSPRSSTPGSSAEESDEVMEITQEEWEAAEHNSSDQILDADDSAATKAYILSVIDDDMEAHERGQLPIRRRKRRIVCSDEEDEGEDEEDKEDEDAEDQPETHKDHANRATSPSTTRAHADLEPSESSQSPSPEPSAADDIVGAWKRSLQPLVDKFNWIPFTTADFEEFTKFMLTIKALQDAVTYDDVYKSGLYGMINDIGTKKNHGKPATRLVRTAKAITAWFDKNLKSTIEASASTAGADGESGLAKRKRVSEKVEIPTGDEVNGWVSLIQAYVHGKTRQSRSRQTIESLTAMLVRLEGCWHDLSPQGRKSTDLEGKLRQLAEMNAAEDSSGFAPRAAALVSGQKGKRSRR